MSAPARFCLSILTVTVTALAGAGVASAATDHVTLATDSSVPAAGELRYEIAHAAPGDTVVIDSGVSPILLTQGEIELDHAITITGQGARQTTIDAGGLSRIFDIDPSNSHNPAVTIQDLTLKGGIADASVTLPEGGAILISGGSLYVNEVTVEGNQAVGSGTTAAQGGGIANQSATMTLDSVTVTGNQASNSGSGVAAGGGLLLSGANSVVNSTIYGNTANAPTTVKGGGIIGMGSPIELISTTVAANTAQATSPDISSGGGNIYSAGGITLENTIVAGGTAPSGANCLTGGGDFTDEGRNLEDTTPSQCGLSAAAPHHDLIGTSPDFVTSAPANNGGETDTLALQPDSPATDYVPYAACIVREGHPLTVDQRGRPRRDIGEDFCDVGAYETQDPLPPPPSATIDSPSRDALVGQGVRVATRFSCREATGGPGIKTCLDSAGRTSPGQLDTSSLGQHTYSVTALSKDGLSSKASVTYRVVGLPSVTITSPKAGGTYGLGQRVRAAFTCSEGAGGPGLASCAGTPANGASIDTTKAGKYSLAVKATSKDGLTRTLTVSYTVLAPGISIGPKRVKVTRRQAKFSLSCTAAPGMRCVGKLTLTRRVHGKTQRLATASYGLSAKGRSTVRVKLSASLLKTLGKAKHQRMQLTLTATVTGGRSAQRSIVLSLH